MNIVVKNPQNYIDKQTNVFKKKMMQINLNSYRTLIGITANGLKASHEEIKTLLNKAFANYNATTV